MNKKMETKKFAFWLFVVMICCFILSGFIFFQSGSYNKILNSEYTEKIDDTKTLKIEGIKEIKVSCTSAEIHIIPSDSNELQAHLYGTTDSKSQKTNTKLDARIENDQLLINVNKPFVIGINFNFFSNLKLDISVPKNYASDLTINTSSGNTKIENLALNALNCKLSSGNFSAEAVTSKDCDLRVSSGNIKLEAFSGNIKAHAFSGNISVAYKAFNNNIDLSASSGNIKLALPESAEFSVKASATSGNVKSDFPLTNIENQSRNKLEGTMVKGNNKIQLKTFSGNIAITK